MDTLVAECGGNMEDKNSPVFVRGQLVHGGEILVNTHTNKVLSGLLGILSTQEEDLIGAILDVWAEMYKFGDLTMLSSLIKNKFRERERGSI